MATGKNIKQTVTTEFAQVGAEGLQKALKDMLLKIESIPGETKKINPVIAKLANDLKALAQTFTKNDLGTDAWITALKEVQISLKTISTLGSGLKLFEKNDLAAATAALKEQARIAKEVVSQNQYQANLRAKFTADQARLEQTRVQKQVQDEASYQAKLRSRYDMQMRAEQQLEAREQARIQKQVQSERELQANLKARGAVTADKAAASAGAGAQNESNYQADLRARAAQRAAAEASAQNERTRKQVEDERNYQANLRARYDAEQAKPSQGQRNLQNRAQLATGEGAASLLLIQGALMANASLLNGAISSIKETIQFTVQLEAAFRNVQAVVGTTNKEMAGLEGVIKQVSTTTKFGAIEVAEAALTLGQAGLSAKQIAEALMPVVTLANAAGSSIAQAVDLVTSVIGVFDKNSNDVADVANKITQAANGSKVSVDKLALGFQYAGNTAAQLGISFEEVTAAMAAMSNAGIKSGSTMGTGLRQFLTEVQKPSEEFLKIMGRLGLSISDLDFKSKGFIGVIRTLKEAGFVASDAINSFDVRGAAAFNALLARPDDLQNQYDSLNGSQAALKANEVQMNSLSAQSSRLTNTLGVLASTGFEPVVQALTGLVRVVSDALGRVTQFEGLLKVLGIALTGLAAAGVVAWIGPLIAGMGTLIGLLPGLVAGTTALTTAFTGLGLASGVGIAVMALVAAYQLYQGESESTAKAIDSATAAMDKAKGAATEKAEVITSLTNRIESLSARNSDLSSSTKDLGSDIDQINGQINRWGYTTDGATASLGGLLIRLREVREEMRKLQLADMRDVAAQAGNVANLKIQDQDEKLGKTRQRLAQGMGSFSGQDEFISKLNDQQKKFFLEGMNKLKAGDQDFLQSGGVSQMASLMQANRPKNGANGGIPGVSDSYDAFSARLTGLGGAAGEARTAQRAAEQAKREADKTEAFNVLRNNLRGQGVDLDSLAGTNIAARAKASLPESDRNEVRINAVTRTMTDQARLELTNQKRLSLAAAQTAEQRAELETLFRSAEETMGESLRKTAPAAVAQLTREGKIGGDEAELSKLKKRIGAKGGGSSDDLAQGSALIKKINERDFLKTAAGMSNEDYAATRVEYDRKAAEQIEALQEQAGRAGASAASSALKSQESSWRKLAESKMKEAKSTRSLVNANSSMEEVSKTMDAGLEKIADAKKIEMDSIARQYGTGSIEGKNLSEAAEEKYKTAAQTFIGSFSGLIETVTDRTVGISKFVKETDAKIKKMFNDFEEQRFSEMGGIRANDREAAINAGPVSGRNRSEVDQFNQTRARYALDLARAQSDLASKQIQAAQLQAAKSGVDTIGANAESKAAILRAQQTSLLGGRDSTQLSTEQFSQYTKITSQLKELDEATTIAAAKSEDYTNKLQKNREEMIALSNVAAGLTETQAQPATWDNLADSMERVWDTYGKIVQEQSVFQTLENGMLGSLKGVQGSFATFFTDVATGTKSVSRAFKDMALSIIKSMMDVLAQALAMQAVKAILGAFGGAMSGGASTGASAGITGSSLSFGSVSMGGSGFSAMATGGPVTGGVPGKDSVPIAAMPGEFVLKKSAVDALGAGYVAQLNEASSSTISASTPARSPLEAGATKDSAPKLLNIWVVTPDQMDSSVGPDDIVTIVSDNISRGGTLKKLVKSVSMGQI